MGDVRGPIVVGADGSDTGARAVRRAAVEAAARGADLHIVHATAPDAPGGHRPDYAARLVREAGQDILDEAVVQAVGQVPGLGVTSTLSQDSAARALLGEAGSDGMIVVGSRRSCWARSDSGSPPVRRFRSSWSVESSSPS
ncbi:universal stress protein [Streptomyces mirabilis]|uniref:universal stress protein n=1 Tax=Streptomyces mirabilis TaxID=68239 RepID=UPI0036BCE385